MMTSLGRHISKIAGTGTRGRRLIYIDTINYFKSYRQFSFMIFCCIATFWNFHQPTNLLTDQLTLLSLELLQQLKDHHPSSHHTIVIIYYYNNYVNIDFLNSLLGTDQPTNTSTLLPIELLSQLKQVLLLQKQTTGPMVQALYPLGELSQAI